MTQVLLVEQLHWNLTLPLSRDLDLVEMVQKLDPTHRVSFQTVAWHLHNLPFALSNSRDIRKIVSVLCHR
jgi:hypothetical protein